MCIATVEQGQGWTVLQYSGQPSHDTSGARQQARAQGALGARHGRWRAARARSRRRQARRRGRWGAVQGVGRAGLEAGGARQRAKRSARGARGATGSRHAGRHGVGVQGRAAGRTERAGHGQLGSTGEWPVRTGWASWVLVHPAWFLAWFFDSVFFLSY